MIAGASIHVSPGANSPDIIVDVRVMHALHLHSNHPSACVRACVRACVHALSFGVTCKCGWECVAPMWRRPAELYREESSAEEEKRLKKITRSLIVEATLEGRREEEDMLPVYRLCTRRLLIKSLLNHVTTLPFERHVAVIPNSVYLEIVIDVH